MGTPDLELENETEEGAEEETEGTASGLTGELTLEAPEGAEFVLDEVKTNRGLKSLGNVPILVWRVLTKAQEHYGDEGILTVCDGTSLRVSFQAIGRRHAMAGKTFDECAQAMINFKPGKRVETESTPVTRAGNAGRRAAAKLGEKADLVTSFLERVAKGEISDEQLEQFGLK